MPKAGAASRREAAPGDRPAWGGLFVGLATVAIGLGVGLVMFDRWREVTPALGTTTTAAAGASPLPNRGRIPRTARPVAVPEGSDVVDEPDREAPSRPISPWEATPENTPPLPPEQTPAWEVRPPPPGNQGLPPPVEPPDPLTYEPPKDNPGGVDGTRGPRPSP